MYSMNIYTYLMYLIILLSIHNEVFEHFNETKNIIGKKQVDYSHKENN